MSSIRIQTKSYRAPEGAKIDLDKWPTQVEDICHSKEQYREVLQHHIEKLDSLQQLHYAINGWPF